MERPYRSPIEIPELLKDYLKGKTFCEIGCGEGDLLKEFAKYADKVYGVEHDSKFFPKLDEVEKECDNIEVLKGFIEIYPNQGGDIKIEDIPKADVYYFWISEGADEILVDKLPPSTMIIHKAGFNKPWLEKTFSRHRGTIEYIPFKSKEVCTYPNGWVCDENTELILGIFHKQPVRQLTINFVVLGWYYEKYKQLIDGLVELKNENPEVINVFYSCHKEPPNIIKDNFEWELFENKGLEWGGYQQAYEHMQIHDDDIYFFLNDDLVIKNWEFVNKCISMFNGGTKVIGNGQNYGFTMNPQSTIVQEADEPIPWGTVTKWIDEVRDENKHIFTETKNHKTIRGSFICIEGKSLKQVGGFEVANCPYEKEDKTQEFGNVSLNMFGYKVCKVFGNNFISYLGTEYADSEYIYEPTGEDRY